MFDNIKFDARRRRPKAVKPPAAVATPKPSIVPGGVQAIGKQTFPSAIPGVDKKGRTAMSAVGAPFPNLYTFFTGRRLDVKLLEQTARAPPVARSIWQLQLIAFPAFKFKIVPPAGQELDEEQVKKLEPKMEEIDRRVKTTIMCVQALYDVLTYGSGIFELTWKEEDGWNVPDVVHRLPAASLRQAPADVIGNKNRYAVGNLLNGIVFDKQENVFLYYQLQNNYGTSGIPIQIPTEQIIHIKDGASPFVDGEPYLQGIVSTIAQLEFARKRLMQTISRVGAPTKTATVGVPEEYLKALGEAPITSAIPGASNTTADIMFTDLWENARQIIEGQSADEGIAVPKGIELKYENVQVPIQPTLVDEYLVKEAIRHFFPTDILDTVAQAISTSSGPLLELIKMMVRGWQRTCCTAFETLLWNKFLELNGFKGYRVELEWDDLIPPDKVQEQKQTVELFNTHIISLDEARTNLGLPPLTPEERAIIVQELQLWRPSKGGMRQQQGMGGSGMQEEASQYEGEPEQPQPYDEFDAGYGAQGNISGPDQPSDQIAQGMSYQEAYKQPKSVMVTEFGPGSEGAKCPASEITHDGYCPCFGHDREPECKFKPDAKVIIDPNSLLAQLPECPKYNTTPEFVNSACAPGKTGKSNKFCDLGQVKNIGLATLILEYVKEYGSGEFNLKNGHAEVLSNGIMASAERNRMSDIDLSVDSITKYLDENEEILSKKDKGVTVWKDEDKWYMNICTLKPFPAKKTETVPKANMALAPDLDTPSKLDQEAQTVLESTESAVLDALKKAGFFDKAKQPE